MSEMDRYDFDLPKELIAQHPRPNRVDARLMLVDRRSGQIEHHHVRDLGELLQRGDALVMNNSRVIPARMVGFRVQTRGRWQGLFLAEDAETGIWEVLAKTRGTLVPGERIMIEDRQGREAMTLECVRKAEGGRWWVKPDQPGRAFELLERFGRVPLPPYILTARWSIPTCVITRRSTPAVPAASRRRPRGCISPNRCCTNWAPAGSGSRR